MVRMKMMEASMLKKKKKGLLGSDQHPGKRRESKRARLGRH